MILLDHHDNPFVGQRLESADAIRVGSTVSMMQYSIRIISIVPSNDQDSALASGSAPSSCTDSTLASGSAPSSCTEVCLSASEPSLENTVRSDTPRLDRWKVTYSIVKDLTRGRMKSYDGTLEIRRKDKFMILNNAKGKQIGCRFCTTKDHFGLGPKLLFLNHIVRM
jgi:hypothetical protein